MKRKNDIEVKEEPPACPASFEVDKAVTTLQQFVLFLRQRGRNARNGGKINMLVKKELSIRKKQSTITSYFKQV